MTLNQEKISIYSVGNLIEFMDAKHKNLYFKDFVMLYTYAHTCSKKDETIKPNENTCPQQNICEQQSYMYMTLNL